MEKLVDLTTLLKDCPEGMPLDCVIFDNVTLSKIDFNIMSTYPIVIKTNNGHGIRLTKYGTYTDVPEAKCVIFPKGKTTWEGFHKPFIDGDIVMCDEDRFAIVKEHISHQEMGYLITYHLYYDEKPDYLDKECGRCIVQRLATEEEIERLFHALQVKGYFWDTETKTLKALDVAEQMIKPKFKSGDRVINTLGNHHKGTPEPQAVISGIDGNNYILTDGDYINISDQDNWELVSNEVEPKFKDGDIVAFDSKYGTHLFIFKEYIKYDLDFARCHVRVSPDGNIDFDDHGYYIGRFASEIEKDKLYQVLLSEGYKWYSKTKTLKKLIKPKFKVGDRVKSVNNNNQYDVLHLTDTKYTLVEVVSKFQYTEPIIEDTNWELVSNEIEPEFKDGDVLYIDCNSNGNNYEIYQYIFILKEITDSHIRCHCFMDLVGSNKEFKICNLTSINYIPRFATDEEKKKLFDAIKESGYNWNSKTKTLEKLKLTGSKFKDGDIIANKNIDGTWIGIYREDGSTTVFSSYCYVRRDGVFRAKPDTGHTYCETRLATEEENKKLLDVIKKNGYIWNPNTKTLEYVAAPSFKVGDSIQSKTDSNVKFTITTIEDNKAYYGSGNGHEFMIPIEKQCNWELVPKFKVGDTILSNTGLQCYTISGVTSEYYSLKVDNSGSVGVLPVKDQDDWTLVQKVKWTPKSLEHFDKVIVRQYDTNPWCIDFFSYYDEVGGYVECTGGVHYNYCIPYNDDTKHLVGKLKEASEVYKYWEER